jgi:hypothetical protein
VPIRRRLPLSVRACQLNRSMQHPIPNCYCNASRRESIRAATLNKNITRAFDLFELTLAGEMSLVDTYEKIQGKCCIDLLRPPVFSESGFSADS